MSLLLEIEYLSGVCFAATGQDSPAPDWPPQPDRVFSAFVATWAARGQNAQEADALEWLEKLDPPRILASGAAPRTSATVFVPPNDPRSDKQKHARGVLPAFRSRQARRFPASRPFDPIVRLLWPDAEPEGAAFAALTRLARDTAYVGHSASLTRCWFVHAASAADQDNANPPRRRVYAGRFAALRRDFERGHRPNLGDPVAPAATVEKEKANIFSDRWLLLEHVAGDMRDLRAAAIVAKTLRDALLSGYKQIGLEDRIPAVVSGHAPDKTPARAPHLAIVPLAFAGFPYADGHVMGFALVPPRGSAILEDEDFRKALKKIAPLDPKAERRALTLKPKEGTSHGRTFCIGLSPTLEPGKPSLDPALYTACARTFATVTPIALDRHLKEKGEARQREIATQIAAACRNIGLPKPEDVVADKHSAIEGAPSAYPSGNSPPWMRWRLPPTLASRQLTHAVIRFAEPVEGPVLLGAGRFVGLGLCRPLDARADDAGA
jgi:CRISPR-associated protein Csb2